MKYVGCRLELIGEITDLIKKTMKLGRLFSLYDWQLHSQNQGYPEQ